MLVDIRTLSMLLVVFAVLNAIGFLSYSISQSKFTGLKTLALSFLCVAAGFFLIAVRGMVPLFVSVIVANLLIYLHAVFLNMGTSRLFKRKQMWSLNIITTVLLPLLFIYYLYINPSVNSRVVIISLMLAVQYFITAYIMIKETEQGYRLYSFVSVFSLIFYAFFSVYRAMWSVFEAEMFTFMDAGSVHLLSLFLFILTIAGFNFGIVMLTNRKIYHTGSFVPDNITVTGLLSRKNFMSVAANNIKHLHGRNRPVSVVSVKIKPEAGVDDERAREHFEGLLRSFVAGKYSAAELEPGVFVIYLSVLESLYALEYSERLRRDIEEKGAFYNISIGVCTLGSDNLEIEDIINKAVSSAECSGEAIGCVNLYEE